MIPMLKTSEQENGVVYCWPIGNCRRTELRQSTEQHACTEVRCTDESVQRIFDFHRQPNVVIRPTPRIPRKNLEDKTGQLPEGRRNLGRLEVRGQGLTFA